MKQRNKKGVFLGMLLGTLGAILTGNMLAVKGVIRAIKATTRAGQNYIQMSPHPSTPFEIQIYIYQNQLSFNGVYSRNNMPKKSEAYVKNLDKYEHWNIGTYWVAIYDENDEVIYFDSFGIEVMSNENVANLYIQQMIQ